MSLLRMKLGGGRRLVRYKNPANGTVVIGGHTYPTVKIGNRWWLAENLKFIPEGINLVNYITRQPAAYYFENDSSYSDEIFYNGYAARYLENNKSNLLPSSWRIPKEDDFEELLLYLESNNLSALDLRSMEPIWNGTNILGFNAAPYGGGSGNINTPNDIGWSRGNAIFWSVTMSDNYDAFGDHTQYRSFIRSTDTDFHIDNTMATFIFSIRLVKDS